MYKTVIANYINIQKLQVWQYNFTFLQQ